MRDEISEIHALFEGAPETTEFRKLLDQSPNANERVQALLNARLRANEARED